MKLRFSEDWTLTGSIADTTTRAYRGNSIYDPDLITQPNNSARMFSLYTSLYNSWTIAGSTMTVDFMSTAGTDPATGAAIAAAPRNVAIMASALTGDQVNAMTYNSFASTPYCKMRTITPLVGSKSYVRLSQYMSTAKIFGLNKTIVQGPGFFGGTGSDPGTTWYHFVVIVKTDAPPCNIWFRPTITYYVKFSNKKPIPL